MRPLCYLVVLLSLLFASCSPHPTEEPTRTIIATTQFAYPTITPTSKPTNTPTPPPPVLTPWGKLIPEPLIFIPGDLPSSYEILAVDHKIPKGSLLYGASLRAPVAKTSIEIVDS